MASCFRVSSELEFPLFGYNFPPNFSIPPTPPPPACCRELLKSSFTSPSLRRPSVPRFLFLPHPAGNRVADVLMGFHSPPLPLCSAPQLKAFFSHFFLLALTSYFFALLIRISVPAYNTGTSLSKVRLYAKWAVSTLELELVLRDDHDYDCPVCFDLFRD